MSETTRDTPTLDAAARRETMILNAQWVMELGEGSTRDGCGKWRGQHRHNFLPNRNRTVFSCSHGCGTRVVEASDAR